MAGTTGSNGNASPSGKSPARLRREERLFRKYVPDSATKYMTERQIQLLREELLLAYRYKIPFFRRVYIEGLWHGINLVEKYFSYSDDALVGQRIHDAQPVSGEDKNKERDE